MIAGALDKVGAEGVLSIENSNSMETTIEVQEGMLIDRGYISPQFITNNERMTVEMENCLVVVADSKVDAVKELVPLLEQVMQSNKPLLIVCEDITGEALATLVVNKLRGIINVAAIKAPGFGERRKALLQDIAIVTGADYLATDLGLSLETATMDNLGTARKVTITKTECTLIADQASAEDISARVAQIKKELSETDSTYDTEKLSERIAKLAGGVAVIKVGAATETELEDRKLRVEDAKNATFAAVEEGIVPGGGATLLHLRDLLPDFKATVPDEEKAGVDILYKALTAPCRIIADNAGSEGEVVVEKVSALPFEQGLQRDVAEVRGPARERRAGPRQGHAQCAAERCRGGGDHAHDASCDCGEAEAGIVGQGRGWGWSRRGPHGLGATGHAGGHDHLNENAAAGRTTKPARKNHILK